jgi:hypothetical protein
MNKHQFILIIRLFHESTFTFNWSVGNADVVYLALQKSIVCKFNVENETTVF